MSILRKGARRITVGGEAYHWRIRKRPTYCQGVAWSNMNVAIEQCEKLGSTLVVELTQIHPSNWMRKVSKPVKPVDMDAFLKRRFARGGSQEKEDQHSDCKWVMSKNQV